MIVELKFVDEIIDEYLSIVLVASLKRIHISIAIDLEFDQ